MDLITTVDSDEMSFKIAASQCFKKGFLRMQTLYYLNLFMKLK
ncbi:MAG: hypothetical protein MZV64_47725 [Ignavibacteriales bacterium]|nr:hypothetical protein [Ignavibacteriales bacterium]